MNLNTLVFVHLGQLFEVRSQNPTNIKNECCRARAPKLFHLLDHHFFDHHGQLFEVCSQNPIICGNESCRARDSEHCGTFLNVLKLTDVFSEHV